MKCHLKRLEQPGTKINGKLVVLYLLYLKRNQRQPPQTRVKLDGGEQLLKHAMDKVADEVDENVQNWKKQEGMNQGKQNGN